MKINKLLFLFCVFTLSFSCKKNIISADILIQNGTVYDGIDTFPKKVSIAIKNDTIAYIGNEKNVSIQSQKIIDAHGLIVSPGFIDPHTHADRDLNKPTASHNKPFLFQGITTVVTGNDGDSFYPLSTYKALYEAHKIGTNVVPLIGHGTIRAQVVGNSNRHATKEELTKMQQLIQQEMDAGAFGISTGLFYAPGSYSTTEEVISLAKVVAQNDGIYDTHLRDESTYTVGLIPAIEEAIEIGRRAQLPIHISHIKCLGVEVWHQSKEIISIIEKAQKEGIAVSANQYPYDASATGLKAAVVPRWAESGGKDSLFIRYNNPTLKNKILTETNKNIYRRGGADKLLIVKSEAPKFVGKNLQEIAEMLKISPEEAVYMVLKTGYVRVASFNMNPDDIELFMKQPWLVTGSDGNTGHPRKFGSFPRKYNLYVKEKKVLAIGSFINASSSKTADILKINNRGRLKVGNFADVIIFNPETFKDKATYNNSFLLSEGLVYSIINGNISIENGKLHQPT